MFFTYTYNMCGFSGPQWKYLVWYFDKFSLSTSYFSFPWYLYINRYVSGNISLSNLSTQYISDKVTLVISLSVMSKLINVSLIKEPTATLSGPFIYLIMDPYYFKGKNQRSTIYFVKLLHMIFVWSTYTVIWCTNIMVRNYFRVFLYN